MEKIIPGNKLLARNSFPVPRADHRIFSHIIRYRSCLSSYQQDKGTRKPYRGTLYFSRTSEDTEKQRLSGSVYRGILIPGVCSHVGNRRISPRTGIFPGSGQNEAYRTTYTIRTGRIRCVALIRHSATVRPSSIPEQ